MRYAIYAAEQMYGGLHGMCSREVIDCVNEEEAINYATERSIDIIQSYSEIYETLDEEVKNCITDDMAEDEIEELYNDSYYEDTEWNIWKIDENKAKDISTRELDKMYYHEDELFIDKYCIKD